MSKRNTPHHPFRLAGALMVAVAAIGLTLSAAEAETRKYGGYWVGANGNHGKFGHKVVREPGYRARTTGIKSHNGNGYVSRKRAKWDREAGTYASGRLTRLPDGTVFGAQRRATKVDDGVFELQGRRLTRDGDVKTWSGTFTRDGHGY